jgi:uncharacterized protein YkwD
VTQPDGMMQQMLRLHNEERKKHNLHPLSLHPKLQQAAQKHALYMREHHILTHKEDQKLGSRITDEGYPLARGTQRENAAKGTTEETPDNVFHVWMNSEEHKKNILDKDIQDVGFGRASEPSGRWYWCADFAKPQG